MDTDFCEVVTVRHGQTEANRTGFLQGHLDTPLDETGIRQAYAVAERLKTEHFDKVYCSDLNRAVRTAEIILKYHPELSLITTEELRERNLGILQGKFYKDLVIQYPEIMASFKVDGSDIKVPDGESLAECNLRLAKFMDRISLENPGKRLLVVTHGGALQCMFRHAVGQTDSANIRPFSGNAAVCVFRAKRTSWQLITWNDCSHLRDLEQRETLTY